MMCYAILVLRYTLQKYVCVGRCPWSPDNAAVRARGGAQWDQRGGHPGLRVHSDAVGPGRHLGAGGQVVLQQRPGTRVPVDPRPAAPGPGHPQGAAAARLPSLQSRVHHAPRPLHPHTHHRAQRRVQVLRVDLRRRGLHGRQDGCHR